MLLNSPDAVRPRRNENHPLWRWWVKHRTKAQPGAGETVSALAVFLGVSQPRLSMILNRTHRPSVDLAQEIVERTSGRVTFEALFNLTDEEKTAEKPIAARWKKPRKSRKDGSR